MARATTALPVHRRTRRMNDITPATLIAWQAQEAAGRPTTARRGYELFRSWRWCATRSEYSESIDASAVEDGDLREEVPSRKAVAFDVLERGQLKAWFGAVRALDNPVVRVDRQALLLTGARREEMAALRWEHVDFRWSSLWIKDKVEKEGRKIPLTPYLASLLLQLKTINDTPPALRQIRADQKAAKWEPSKWVFFSNSATGQASRRAPHSTQSSIGVCRARSRNRTRASTDVCKPRRVGRRCPPASWRKSWAQTIRHR